MNWSTMAIRILSFVVGVLTVALVTSQSGQSQPAVTGSETCGFNTLFRSVQPRLFGGQQVQNSEWPWMVAVREANKESSPRAMCAGVLVGTNTVLTTARCIDALNLVSPNLEVVVGEHDITVENETSPNGCPEEVISVASSQTHQTFKAGCIENDVAVVRLARDVAFRDCAVPACLPGISGRNAENCSNWDECYIAGWGTVTANDTTRSSILRSMMVKVLDHEACQLVYEQKWKIAIPQGTVCISSVPGEGKPGRGDEGGMVVCSQRGRWILRGLISYTGWDSDKVPLATDLLATSAVDMVNSQ